MKRSTIVVILTLVGFVAFLLWTTLSAQKVECTVCVEFGGGRTIRGIGNRPPAASDQELIETVDALKPALLRSAEHPDFLYLLMPVRVS